MRPEVDARTVELCGLPGGGKSLIASSVAERLGARGLEVTLPLAAVAATQPLGRRVGTKVLIALREVARAPVDSVHAVVAIHRSGQSRRDLLHRSLNWLVVRGLYRQARRRPGIHVFDQGIVQEMCSIGYDGADWRACLPASGPRFARLGPDVLIIVVTSVDTALARLDVRPGHQSRLERRDAVKRRAELERQGCLLEQVERAWFELHGRELGTQRIEVGNEDGRLADAVEVVVAHAT